MTFEKEGRPDLPLKGFYLFLGLSIILCVTHDITNGVWNIHTGDYYPWRHPGYLPLFPAPFLIIEWLLLLVSASMIISKKWRPAGTVLAALGIFIDLTQRFSNHRSLILIVLLYLCIPTQEGKKQPIQMIRYQLLLVYLFSAANKINSGFLDGQSLLSLGNINASAMIPNHYVRLILSPSLSVPLSYLVVVTELVLPLFLLRSPRVGVFMVVLLHTSFGLLMPGIWAFGSIMVAMAFLFLFRDPLAEARGISANSGVLSQT